MWPNPRSGQESTNPLGVCRDQKAPKTPHTKHHSLRFIHSCNDCASTCQSRAHSDNSLPCSCTAEGYTLALRRQPAQHLSSLDTGQSFLLATEWGIRDHSSAHVQAASSRAKRDKIQQPTSGALKLVQIRPSRQWGYIVSFPSADAVPRTLTSSPCRACWQTPRRQEV
jgi:hypothetical protein